jgi:hypothetical protein
MLNDFLIFIAIFIAQLLLLTPRFRLVGRNDNSFVDSDYVKYIFRNHIRLDIYLVPLLYAP